jgi:hypothetical protein
MTPPQNPANPLFDPRRRRSEEATAEGEKAMAESASDRARSLFAEAAAIEEAVARDAPLEMPRARSAVAVAAVSLWHRAGKLSRAKTVAYRFLGQENGLSESGYSDLERLVERCSREMEVTRLTNDSGMEPVDFKIDGPKIGKGVAPEGAVRRRRDTAASLLRRTGEMEGQVEYRERGESELERNDEIQILDALGVAASYGIRLYVATGTQQRIRSEQKVSPKRIVERFLELAAAAADGPEALRREVPDPQYAHAFLDGFAEIAPDGDEVSSVDCWSSSWRVDARPLKFSGAAHRRDLRRAASVAVLRDPRPGEKVFEGKLVEVRLTRDSCWIELNTGRKKQEIITVNEKRLRAKVAVLPIDTDESVVRVYARYSSRQQRPAMTEVVSLREILASATT